MKLRVLTLLCFAAGCGPTRYEAFCEQSVAAGCKQAFRCKADESKQAFTDQAGCEKSLTERAGCSRYSDTSSACTLSSAQTSRCLNDLENAPCTSTPGALPESCRSVQCTDGALRCSKTSSTGSNTTCSNTFSECSDGNTYVLQCDAGGACSCSKNGSATRTFSGDCASSTSDMKRTQINSECDFGIQ